MQQKNGVARYGGEEMALVLPNASRAQATGIAEQVRRTIAARVVTVAAKQIPMTASIGVALYEPGCPFREVQHLFKAADLAVYAAKHAGRNCVKVFSLASAAKTSAA